jgi:hypothetical protein
MGKKTSVDMKTLGNLIDQINTFMSRKQIVNYLFFLLHFTMYNQEILCHENNNILCFSLSKHVQLINSHRS